jgi:hypothetical protein
MGQTAAELYARPARPASHRLLLALARRHARPQVVDLYTLQLAAQRVLVAERLWRLQTHTLHAELIFYVSGSRHVGGSSGHCSARPPASLVMRAAGRR